MKKLLFISAFLMSFCFSATAQYSCVMGACVENVLWGEYETLDACEEECEEESGTLWECTLGSCYEDLTGLIGTYSSQEACEVACSSDGGSYLGQWYTDNNFDGEEEYVLITADFITVISLDGDCYEFEYITYVDSLGYFFVNSDGMILPVEYSVDGDSLFLSNAMMGTASFGTNDDDVSEFVDCADSYTWACDMDGCYDAGVGNGEFESQEDCEWECLGQMTYDCTGGSCVEANGDGSYDSMEECEEECDSSSEFMYECIAGACIDVSFWGATGSYETLEDCEAACDSSAVSTYLCLPGGCMDVGTLGDYETLSECEKECDPSVTYSCIAGACIDSGPFGGEYESLEECEANCNETETLWVCALGSCYEDLTGFLGTYATQEDCEAACTETAVEESVTTITLAPNPFSDYTILEFTNNPTHYTVFDVSGRLVRTEKITANHMQFSRGDLPSGIYYLEVIGNEAVIREKLLIE